MVDGVEKPIAYFSRVLNGTQRNYCPTRRELLAIITSLQHFRHDLLGNKVILRTDHHSLKWLRTFKRPEARWIKHWQSLISRLNIAQDVYTPMPMRFLDKTANSVGRRSPSATGLTNVKERTSSSSHCLFTRFSCAPSSQTMPLPSYKQKTQRKEKLTK